MLKIDFFLFKFIYLFIWSEQACYNKVDRTANTKKNVSKQSKCFTINYLFVNCYRQGSFKRTSSVIESSSYP